MLRADDENTRQRAARIIAAGGVLAFRTDTFYGLGADPFNRQALQKIYDLKGRDDGKPLLVIISDAAQAERLIETASELFQAYAREHWPGPITLVAKAREHVPPELTARTGTLGVRLPDDERVRDFVRATGGALTATSANPAGEQPARSAQEVAAYFERGLDLIVDDGVAPGGLPSTVLDVMGRTPRLIRAGAISAERLRLSERRNDES